MKWSRASCRISGDGCRGFVSLRALEGIARLRTDRAISRSILDGSVVARKPRWINAIAATEARMIIATNVSRNPFQRFMRDSGGGNPRPETWPRVSKACDYKSCVRVYFL